MSLARAVTKRIKRSDASKDSLPPSSRSKSTKTPALQFDRSKISSPVVLLSTTNMLSYDAPDIATLRQTPSSNVSIHSADDSDHSTIRSRSSSHGSSHDTLTDASSVSSSPTSPAPNHLSEYFGSSSKAPRRSVSSGNLQQPKAGTAQPIPAIPERALSHSKRAHERLAQKRSLQNMMPHSGPGSLRSSREQRTSLDIFSPTIEEEETHPFGKELEQLDEVAEGFGGVVRDAEVEADLAAIRQHDLAVFCAADYLQEITPLYSARFGFPRTPAPMAWI